jgi:predicted transposase YbfD/YdcC
MDQGQPGLLEHFAELPDPRDGPLYPLAEILLLALCAILCGAEDWTAVAMWGQAHREWLQRYSPFAAGIPSHDTIGRVFAMLDAKRFEACFLGWMQSLCPALAGLEIAIDGKTVRRAHARRLGKRAIHWVSAFADRLGVMLGQVKTDDKSNEITAIPALLEALAIKGCLVSIDAMGNQRAIARQIIEAG